MKLRLRQRVPGFSLVLYLLLLSYTQLYGVESKWEPEILAFEAQDRANPPAPGGVLFIGSSSIRLWTSLEQDFSGYHVINRGFGGSEIRDSVFYIDRIVVPYRPRLIVMYAGGNDINGGKQPEQVAAAFQDFVKGVLSRLPKTRIAFISIAPNPARWSQVKQVQQANALIKQFVGSHTQLSFINVFPRMLGADGQPRADLFAEDRLHMNSKGYAIWTELVRPFLKRN